MRTKGNHSARCAVAVLLAIALLSVVAVLGSAQGADPRGTIARILDKGQLQITFNLAAEKYQFKDKDNLPAGMAVDLAKMIAADLDVDLVMTDTSWEGLIPALLANKTDFLATTMSTTFARAQKVLFTSETWYLTGVSIWNRKADPVVNWETLNNPKYTVGAVAGTVSEEVAKAYLPNAKLQTYQIDTDVWEALLTNRISAAMNDNVFKDIVTANYPGKMKLLTEPRELVKTDTWAFTVRPGDEFTWHYLNFFIQKTRENGELGRLEAYWTKGDQWRKDYIEKGPISKEREQLVRFLGIQDYEKALGGKYRVIMK